MSFEARVHILSMVPISLRMFSAFAEQLVDLKKIVLSLKSGVLDIFHVLRVLFSKLLFQIYVYIILVTMSASIIW
jgi:hypothetical protein